MGPVRAGHCTDTMFFFYSNRLGCAGSVAVSLILSLVLVGILLLVL